MNVSCLVFLLYSHWLKRRRYFICDLVWWMDFILIDKHKIYMINIIHINRVKSSLYSHIICKRHPSYLYLRISVEPSKQYSVLSFSFSLSPSLILFHFRVPIHWCGKSPSIRFLCISRRYFTYGWIWKRTKYMQGA